MTQNEVFAIANLRRLMTNNQRNIQSRIAVLEHNMRSVLELNESISRFSENLERTHLSILDYMTRLENRIRTLEELAMLAEEERRFIWYNRAAASVSNCAMQVYTATTNGARQAYAAIIDSAKYAVVNTRFIIKPFLYLVIVFSIAILGVGIQKRMYLHGCFIETNPHIADYSCIVDYGYASAINFNQIESAATGYDAAHQHVPHYDKAHQHVPHYDKAHQYFPHHTKACAVSITLLGRGNVEVQQILQAADIVRCINATNLTKYDLRSITDCAQLKGAVYTCHNSPTALDKPLLKSDFTIGSKMTAPELIRCKQADIQLVLIRIFLIMTGSILIALLAAC